MALSSTPVRENPLDQLQLASHQPGLDAASEDVAATASVPTRATFLRSFTHAWDGVTYAIRTQRNARVHLAAATGALTLGVALHISAVEFALIFLAIMAVLVAELFNTVVEAVVDLVTDRYHPLAKVAKDVAAGGVLLCAMFAVVIGLLVFGPHLWPLATHLAQR